MEGYCPMNESYNQQLSKIMETLGRLDERSEQVEKALLGSGGQPGILARVDALESSRDKLWGAGAVMTFFAGLAEYFIHKR